MPQSKMLLDTCSYLRLAQSIHPLLFAEFGEKQYCLYVIEAFQEEFEKNLRLRTKFSWVNQPQYLHNRSQKIQASSAERKNAEFAYDYIVAFADTAGLGISRIDAEAAAMAYILHLPLITDDAAILTVCKEFGVHTMKTVELLKLMADCQYIDMGKIREIAAYWQYEKDMPKDFFKDYKKLFHEPPPTYEP